MLATGSRVPRDLPVPGRELTGFTSRWTTSTSATAGWPASSVPRRRRPSPAAGERDQRRGQARGGDRRRRHRRGLRRQRAARGRAPRSCSSSCCPSRRPSPRRAHAVAAVAAEVPPLLRDGGGPARGRGRAGLLDRTARFSGDGDGGSPRCTSPRPSPRRRLRPSRGPSASCRRNWCCWRWASCTPSSALLDQLGVEKDPRGNVKARLALHDLGRGRVRRRGRPPRPVADRVGDQRGAPVRADGGPLSRGLRNGAVAQGVTCPKTGASPATPTPTKAPRGRRTRQARRAGGIADDRLSARSLGRRDLQLPADLARQAITDLAVARDRRPLAMRARPTRVIAALVDRASAVPTGMTLELAPLHAAIVSCRVSRSRLSFSSPGSGESIRRSASRTFSRAS